MAFYKATSGSLPCVNFHMILEFLKDSDVYCSAEYRGAKAARSSRPDYGDKAIGFVEVKRENETCYVRAKITPEHRVRTKPYIVSAIIDEQEDSIINANCENCASSQGGCKHAIALLFWLHRRTEEPAPTSTISYWRRSALSTLGDKKVFTLKDICRKNVEIPSGSGEMLQKALQLCEEHQVTNMLTITSTTYLDPSLHRLYASFLEERSSFLKDAEKFLEYCSSAMTIESCQEIVKKTKEQSHCSLWFEMRYGRITASNIYACTRCKTERGSLVESILGSSQAFNTSAMTRGKNLESEVIKELKKQVGLSVQKCGIFLKPAYPFLGASPDAQGDDFICEVKCPSKDIHKYLHPDGSIGRIYEAQIQLQMMLCSVQRGLFVVADPLFEENRIIFLRWVNYNHKFCLKLVNDAKNFWISSIFPNL